MALPALPAQSASRQISRWNSSENGEIKRDGNAATLQATSQPGIKLIRPNLTWVSGTAEHGTFTLCDDMEVHHPIIKGSGKAGGAAAYLLFKGCADLKVYEPIARNNAGLVFDSSGRISDRHMGGTATCLWRQPAGGVSRHHYSASAGLEILRNDRRPIIWHIRRWVRY